MSPDLPLLDLHRARSQPRASGVAFVLPMLRVLARALGAVLAAGLASRLPRGSLGRPTRGRASSCGFWWRGCCLPARSRKQAGARGGVDAQPHNPYYSRSMHVIGAHSAMVIANRQGRSVARDPFPQCVCTNLFVRVCVCPQLEIAAHRCGGARLPAHLQSERRGPASHPKSKMKCSTLLFTATATI